MSMTRIDIDEATLPGSLLLPPDVTIVGLSNSHGSEVPSIVESLSKMRGRERVEQLEIGSSSQLRDVAVTNAFPMLKRLLVFGKKLSSLNGIEWFKNGTHLSLDTGSNRRRDLEKLGV